MQTHYGYDRMPYYIHRTAHGVSQVAARYFDIKACKARCVLGSPNAKVLRKGRSRRSYCQAVADARATTHLKTLDALRPGQATQSGASVRATTADSATAVLLAYGIGVCPKLSVHLKVADTSS